MAFLYADCNNILKRFIGVRFVNFISVLVKIGCSYYRMSDFFLLFTFIILSYLQRIYLTSIFRSKYKGSNSTMKACLFGSLLFIL